MRCLLLSGKQTSKVAIGISSPPRSAYEREADIPWHGLGCLLLARCRHCSRRFCSRNLLIATPMAEALHGSRTIQLAFLAPDIVEAILAGHQPVELTPRRLMRTELPIEWHRQRCLLGFPG